MKLLALLVCIKLLVFSVTAIAWSQLSLDSDIHCSQNKTLLECDYRLLQAPAAAILAQTGNTTLPIIEQERYTDNEVTAVLFLVDTSDPNRQLVIDNNKQQIKALINQGKVNYQFGLAAFDKTMRIKASIGKTTAELEQSLITLNATGLTTELYRSLLEAIAYLDTVAARRKLIVLFSDGQAEDKAYFHSDVITAARQSKVVINSIGLPRSVSLSVALQTLRRLSEESGGNYIEADYQYQLPQRYYEYAFNNIDHGGRFTIDLSNQQATTVTLSLTTASSYETFSVPVTTTYTAPTVTTVDTPVVTLTPALETTTSSQQLAVTTPLRFVWYGLPILVIIAGLWLFGRRPNKKVTPTRTTRSYAYLVSHDDNNMQYPIEDLVCRIGRDKDNEIQLDDLSVSRQHAQIQKNRDGSFTIVDINSKNGIYVNNKRIKKTLLKEADIIEIGDIMLHFSQTNYTSTEETVVYKTRAPLA